MKNEVSKKNTTTISNNELQVTQLCIKRVATIVKVVTVIIIAAFVVTGVVSYEFEMERQIRIRTL